MKRKPDSSVVTVVAPFLNEAAIIESLVAELRGQLGRIGYRWNMVLVNDGSTDQTPEILDRLAADDARIQVVHLSRNFGHPSAVQAGLAHAGGDAVVLMDGDGQDCPTAIPQMVELWENGNHVVYAIRFGRKENPFKRILFYAFYRLLHCMTSTPIPQDAGNFSLMDRTVVDHLLRLPESDRYLPGLRSWLGFRQVAIPVERRARHDRTPRVSFLGLVSLAKTALFGFSRVPLLTFYWMSILSAIVSVGCISFGFYHKLVTGLAVPGWASITSVSAFFGAINSLGIAILGDYVARIYEQVRGRPTYIVAQTRNLPDSVPAGPKTVTEEDSLLKEILILRKELAEHSRNPGAAGNAIDECPAASTDPMPAAR